MMGIGQNSIHMLVFSKDGQKIFTANRGSASVAVVSPSAPGGPGGGRARAGSGGARPGRGPGGGPGARTWGRSGRRPGRTRPGDHPGAAGPRGDRHHARRHPGLGRLPGAISIIDAASDQVVGTIETGGGGINRIKFTPDGKRALATHMGPLIILDVASRKEIKRIDTGGGGSSILIVPDGSRAYIGMTARTRSRSSTSASWRSSPRSRRARGPTAWPGSRP